MSCYHIATTRGWIQGRGSVSIRRDNPDGTTTILWEKIYRVGGEEHALAAAERELRKVTKP